MKGYGFNEEYNKGDLAWLEDVLFEQPKLVRTAIVNSDQRTKQSQELFLTVQELTKRLKKLSVD